MGRLFLHCLLSLSGANYYRRKSGISFFFQVPFRSYFLRGYILTVLYALDLIEGLIHCLGHVDGGWNQQPTESQIQRSGLCEPTFFSAVKNVIPAADPCT